MGSASCMCALAGGERRVSFLSFSNLKKMASYFPRSLLGKQILFCFAEQQACIPLYPFAFLWKSVHACV